MHVHPKILLLLFASAVSAIAVSLNEPDQNRGNFVHQRLEKRRGNCANGLREAIAYDNEASRMLCLDDSKSVSDWSGNAASIIAALGAGATGIIYAVARLIEVKQRGGTVSNSSPVRRLARREEEERVFGNVTIGGVEVEVPFVLDAEGKSTMNLLDFYSQASPSLETRAFSEETALPTGGTMTFYANGTLDTFTVDFAVPFTADATSSTLAKRDSNSLHTTYWAAPGHEHTSLSNYYLEGLVRASYTLQGSHVWESCGYMANSGTWHGAFRHWTGDRGYTNGECELARKY